MNTIIYKSTTRFNKFYIKGLFTNELEQCTEEDFDDIVSKHRRAFDLQYDGINAQNFLLNGKIYARRERS